MNIKNEIALALLGPALLMACGGVNFGGTSGRGTSASRQASQETQITDSANAEASNGGADAADGDGADGGDGGGKGNGDAGDAGDDDTPDTGSDSASDCLKGSGGGSDSSGLPSLSGGAWAGGGNGSFVSVSCGDLIGKLDKDGKCHIAFDIEKKKFDPKSVVGKINGKPVKFGDDGVSVEVFSSGSYTISLEISDGTSTAVCGTSVTVK